MNSLLPHLKIFRIRNKKEKRNLKQQGYDHGREIGRQGDMRCWHAQCSKVKVF